MATRNPYTPTDSRYSGSLSKFLEAIDVPECKCPIDKNCQAGEHGYPKKCPGKSACDECPFVLDPENPCPHVAAAVDHQFSIEDWAKLLWAAKPASHCEPPLDKPDIALSQSARVSLYMRRAQKLTDGSRTSKRKPDPRAIFHPDDYHHDQLHEVGVQAVVGKGDTGIKIVDATAEWFPVAATTEAWVRVACEVVSCCAIVRRILDLLERCEEEGGLKRQERERLRWLLALHEPPVDMDTTWAILGQLGLEWEEMR